MLEIVKRELKTVEAKRELKCFEKVHKLLQREFKELCIDDGAIEAAILLAKSCRNVVLAKRLIRILGRNRERY